jgi:predicted PP-loop superfamily ATPase
MKPKASCRSLVLSLLIIAPFYYARAQSQDWLNQLKKLPNTIYVEHSGDDAVGNSLTFAIKERLYKSKKLTLGSQESAQLRLMLTTTGISGGKDSSAVAVVLTMHQPIIVHIYHWVYVVGADRVNQSAEEIVASLDEVLDKTVRK